MPKRCDGCSLCPESERLAGTLDALNAQGKTTEAREVQKGYDQTMRQIRQCCPEKCH